MRTIFQLKKNKSALSDVIAYVLLIAITISLSVLVYNWLRFQFDSEETAECPEAVDVILSKYDCSAGSWLEIGLKNKGRFNVTGYIVRAHNRTGADFGIYILDNEGFGIAPGESLSWRYNSTNSEVDHMGNITFLEVQPFLNDRLMCKSLSTQDIQCFS